MPEEKAQGSAVGCAEERESTSYSLQSGEREQAPVCQGSSDCAEKRESTSYSLQSGEREQASSVSRQLRERQKVISLLHTQHTTQASLTYICCITTLCTVGAAVDLSHHVSTR